MVLRVGDRKSPTRFRQWAKTISERTFGAELIEERDRTVVEHRRQPAPRTGAAILLRAGYGMGKAFAEPGDDLRAFVARQHVFFVGDHGRPCAWADNTGEDEVRRYRTQKNRTSIDGPSGLPSAAGE